MFKTMKTKSKKAGAAIGTTMKVLTSVVCGALVITGTCGVVKTAVLPTTTTKMESMFEYSSDGTDVEYNSEEFEMLNGAEQTYLLGQSKPLSFRSAASLDTFKEVIVDDSVVEKNNYILTEGSTIVTFSEEYVSSLKDGKHIVSIVSEGGSARTSFTTVSTAIVRNEIIPIGAIYTIKSTNTTVVGNGINKFPLPENGDIYVEGDYEYTFSTLSHINGWKVLSRNKSQKTYGEIISELAGKPITYMGGTFSGCAFLTTSPVIPYNVTNMEYAFSGCKSLTSAPEIPVNVTYMYGTFADCYSLNKAPILPVKVQNLKETFKSCKSLAVAPEIPSSVTDMYGTFSYCETLVEAPAIPEGVTTLSEAFKGCISLKAAPKIPKSVKQMNGTFSGCTLLTDVPEIPGTVTSICGAFQFCRSLVDAPVIRDGIKNMSNAFYGCTALISAPDIPYTVMSIDNAFNGCVSLVGTITINSNPTYYINCLKGTQISEVIGATSLKTELLETK